MMKSFFKKLAFVMALAMVVSMVAPAGSALAAESGVSLQGTKTIVETYELDKAGATVDFSFQGAPKDWKTTYAWSTSNPAVATVDKAGVVTAVAAGTATITITAGADASYSESVVITVKGEEGFTVTQTTADTFVVTFDSEQTYTYEDFTVTEVFDTVTVDAPIKASEFKAGTGTTVKLKLTAAVDDLVPYEISFKGKTETIVASAGAVDSVKFGYYTSADNAENVYGAAYVETEDENNTVHLYPVFYDVNGVDVSSLVDADEFSIDYVAVQESDKFTIGYDELTFEAPFAATVKMTTEWFDEDGEEYTSEYVDVVVATKRAPLKVSFMDGGVFFESGTSADTCSTGAWASAGEGDYTEDFTLQPWGYAWSAGKATKEIVLGDTSVPVYVARVSDNRKPNTTSTTVTYVDRGEISYASSNENIFEIDSATGEITAKKVGSASVLVYFLENDAENPVLVGSTKLTVKAERYPATVAINTTQVKIANAGLDTGSNVKITVKDQYGQSIDLANGTADITVEAASSKNTTVLDAERTNTGEYKIFFNASDFEAFTSSSASHSYNVTFDKTENKKLDKSKLSFSVRIYNITEEVAEITAAGYDEFKYAVNFENNHYGSTVDVKVNATGAYNFGWPGSNVADPVKEQNIGVYYVNKNGFRVAAVDTMTAMADKQKTGEAGTVYYTITEPTIKRAGDDNNAEWSVAGNKVTWKFNTQDGTTFSDYAKEGTYKVTLYTTKSNDDDLKKLGDYNITVVNSAPMVSFSGYTDDYAKYNNSHYWDFNDVEDAVAAMSQSYAAGTDADVITAIYKCLKFWYTPEVDNWYYNQANEPGLQANITGYTAKKISNSKIAIKDVTFEITLPGRTEKITRTIRVNSSISK